MKLNELFSFSTIRSIYRDFSKSEMLVFVILLTIIIALSLTKVVLTYKTRTEVSIYSKLLITHQNLSNTFNNYEIEYLTLTQNQFIADQARIIYKLQPLSIYNQVFLEFQHKPFASK